MDDEAVRTLLSVGEATLDGGIGRWGRATYREAVAAVAERGTRTDLGRFVDRAAADLSANGRHSVDRVRSHADDVLSDGCE